MSDIFRLKKKLLKKQDIELCEIEELEPCEVLELMKMLVLDLDFMLSQKAIEHLKYAMEEIK